MSSILYAQATNPQQVNSSQFVDMEGLVLTLPATSTTATAALLILSVTAPYATGNNFPGITFSIEVGGQSVAMGGFTYDQETPASSGRKPFSMAVQVSLTTSNQIVEVQWSSVRGSTGFIDEAGYASLAAVLG
jgi:hypothetical protein